MKKNFFLSISCIFLFFASLAEAASYSYLSQEVLQQLGPYLLPETHPIKKRLDKIFSKQSIADSESVRRAGFFPYEKRPFSYLTVATHLSLKGYYVKFYTDDEPKDSLAMCLNRVQGAEAIRQNIKAHNFEKHFCVPLKWIYPLPELAPGPKKFILVVEDMRIRHKGDNLKRWRKDMTPDRLNAIYVMLQELGLQDSIYPFNLPYTIDGKNAFIDTEIHHRWPVYFGLLLKYLSSEMEEHWRRVVGNGGPFDIPIPFN